MLVRRKVHTQQVRLPFEQREEKTREEKRREAKRREGKRREEKRREAKGREAKGRGKPNIIITQYLSISMTAYINKYVYFFCRYPFKFQEKPRQAKYIFKKMEKQATPRGRTVQ